LVAGFFKPFLGADSSDLENKLYVIKRDSL